jgi:hypothetical protein
MRARWNALSRAAGATALVFGGYLKCISKTRYWCVQSWAFQMCQNHVSAWSAYSVTPIMVLNLFMTTECFLFRSNSYFTYMQVHAFSARTKVAGRLFMLLALSQPRRFDYLMCIAYRLVVFVATYFKHLLTAFWIIDVVFRALIFLFVCSPLMALHFSCMKNLNGRMNWNEKRELP